MIRTQMVPCMVCGSAESMPVYTARDRAHNTEGDYTYTKCARCGLVFMNPQVLPEDLGKLYPPNYTPHTGGQSTSGRFGIVSTIWKYLMSMSKLKKQVADGLTADSKVLDVGCGSGAFLNEIKRTKNCSVFGVDVSPKAVEIAKQAYGIDVFQGNVTDVPWPDSSFDLVTGWQYIEHLNDPHTAVEKMKALIKPGGSLVLATPNFNSINSKLLKTKWFPLECPRHLSLWTPKTITILLQQHGLEVDDIVFDATPWSMACSLMYVLHENTREAHKIDRVLQSKFFRIALLPWTVLTAIFKASDVMIVYARKK